MRIFALLLVALTACGSSHEASASGDIPSGPGGALARAIAQVDELKDAQDAIDRVHDWLMLRVAGTESDSAKRVSAFAAVRLAVAQARVPWTDAQARERFGDALGAVARYASVGAAVPALRLRLSVAPDSATRNQIKDELLAFIRGHAA